MEIFHWLGEDGIKWLEAIGLIASLGFTAFTVRKDDRSRRISNLLALTAEHRDIWTELYRRPELSRVLEPRVDLRREPITNAEALFVTFLLLHLSATYRAMKEGMFTTRQALDRDIAWFLALPIPAEVWNRSIAFLEPDFVAYVAQSLETGRLER